jgi:Uma2 family endonuclease
MAPVDVYLLDEEDEEARNVVQPDVIVVCDESTIREDGVYGAPDFIAEILSPSTAHKDLGEKRDLYEKAGVREYWLLNPDNGSILAWRRSEKGFSPVAEYPEGSGVPCSVLPGFNWKAVRARKFGAAKS